MRLSDINKNKEPVPRACCNKPDAATAARARAASSQHHALSRVPVTRLLTGLVDRIKHCTLAA